MNTDAAVMNALYTLADYPMLAELAAKRTQAGRLDGRACHAIYVEAMPGVWQAVSDHEREFMRRLGLDSDGLVAQPETDEPKLLNIYMKHSGSTADDLDVKYIIHKSEQCVTLNTNSFDSKLMEYFFLSVLKGQHGIDAVRDDRNDWNPPRPPYRVYLLMNGVRYEVEAHHLVELGGRNFTVVLKPYSPSESER